MSVCTDNEGPRQDDTIAELRGIRIAIEQLLQFAAARAAGDVRPMDESEVIAWLIRHMQDATELPTLAGIARETGVNTRQLRADRWPRFRKTYDQLAGLQRGIDKTRMVALLEDLEDE